MDEATERFLDASPATGAEADASSIVLDVSSLASQLRLGKLSGPLRVKGKSVAATPWKRNEEICFGILGEGKAKLRYRVPTTSMPRHGEEVVITGTLCLSPLTFELQLHGDVEGAWQPKERLPRLPIPKRSTPEPLAQFLEHHPVTALGFIATDIGWADVERSAGRVVAGCLKEFPNFGDEDDVIAAVERLAKDSRIKAIVVARGGGGMLDEIGNSDKVAIALIHRKVPFYMALGHSNDLMLLGKYADESFGAPADFGHWLRLSLERIANNQALHQRVEQLDGQNEELKGTLAQRDQNIEQAKVRSEALQQQLDTVVKVMAHQGKIVKWMGGGLIGMTVVILVMLGLVLHS